MSLTKRHLVAIGLAAWLLGGCETNTVSDPPVSAVMRQIDIKGGSGSNPRSYGPVTAPPDTSRAAGATVSLGRSGIDEVRVAAPTRPEPGSLRVVVRNTTLGELLDMVITGLLHASYVVDGTLDRTLPVTLQGDIPAAQAREVLRDTLEYNGYALDERGGVFHVRHADRPGSARLRAGDSVYMFKLGFLTAPDFMQMASGMIDAVRLRPVTGDPSLLLFAGSAREYSQLSGLSALLDVFELRNAKIDFVPLAHADANAVVRQASSVLGGRGAGFPRLVALPAQHAVVIVAPRSFHDVDVVSLLRQLDGGGAPDAPLYAYEPRHRRAQELFGLLKSLAQAATAPAAIPGAQGGGPSPDMRAPLAAVRAQTAPAPPGPADPAASSAIPPANVGPAVPVPAIPVLGGGETAPPPSFLTDADDPMSEIRQLVAGTMLDEGANTLGFHGSAAQFDTLRRILDTWDRPKAQILVEAVVLEVELNNQLALGVQYSLNQETGSRSSIIGQLTDETGLDKMATGLVLKLGRGGVNAVISALAAVTSVNVLTSPKVLVANGEKASLHFGQSVPILLNQTNQTQQGYFTQSNQVSYRNTGIELQVRPTGIGDRLVELHLHEHISDIATDHLGDTKSPVFNDRDLQTLSRVQYGDTILLGGVIEDRSTVEQSGVPGLRDIPVLGTLFSHRSRSTRRTELVLLLTPRLYYDADAPEIPRDDLDVRFSEAFALLRSQKGDTKSDARFILGLPDRSMVR